MDWAVDTELGSVSGVDPDTQCGFELGDWYSFVSLDSGALDATRTLRSSERQDSFYCAEHYVSLRSGSGIVTQTEVFRGDGIDRTLELRPAPEMEIGDFVLRFVFDADTFPVADIADQTFKHHGRNRYLQFDVERVRLWGGTREIFIDATASSLPDAMDLVVYVRDEQPNRWVVHVRALVRHTNHGFVRLYDFPVTRLSFLDELVRRLRLTGLLRYCRERGTTVRYLPDALPFQYVESVELDDDDTVELRADCRVESGSKRAKR